MDHHATTMPPVSGLSRTVMIALAVLALCFVLSVVGRGLGESFTVFLLPISDSFGWDRGQVISIYSLAALTGGLVAPFVGRLFDRSGPRATYALGLVALGGAFLVAAYAERLWQFQLSLGLCVGLGIASIGNVPNSILLGRWFGKGLPTAMSVVYSATGAGVLVMLPLSQLLIDHIGWRGAYRAYGIAMLVLLVPLLLLPWRRLAVGSPEVVRPAANTAHDDDHWTLPNAMRHHAFWALFATFFFTAIGMFAISAQVVAYLIDAGFPPLTAATAWGFSGVVLLFGMLSITWLDGVIGRRRSVLFSYALSIVGIAMLWLLKSYPSYALLTGFVICFGSMIGSRGPLITATAMKIFRGRRVGTIYGTISIGSGLGSAMGSWCGGLIHDFTGSYDALLAFALVAVILGMLPFLVVPALR
ncbi:MFS transporter [Bradyrhizobium sp. U87765 SZCCT0109]|uniref:MFS transporter n=2 Tax=Bradyrhizobium TaxID=374 RepID=UPI00352E3AE2